MGFLSPIKLWDTDKLRVLQRLDKYRQWHSLEEKRYCLVCGHVITGRTIFVIGGSRGNGPMRIICPTPNCHSIPMDWVLPPDEVLQNVGKSPEFQEYLAPQAQS
jgi:hypothetical protein